jgi:TatD DNase family protein
LDRHYPNPPQATQRRILDEQLGRILAWRGEGLEKPIVVHCRDAFAELLPILADTGLPRDRFVFHCFTGSLEDARAVIDFGAWISFTGVVTFRNAAAVAEAARIAPAERMLVETDSPFLSPEPVRTTRPNEPRFVAHVARRIAALRGESEERCAARLDANAERFFGIAIRR